MAKLSLSRASLARLVVLSGRLNRAVVELETIATARDARTGTFKKAGSISPKTVRAAWATAGMRARPHVVPDFKTDLLNALRSPRK